MSEDREELILGAVGRLGFVARLYERRDFDRGDGNAFNGTAVISQRLIGEVVIGPLRRATCAALQCQRHRAGRKGLAGRIHVVEERDQPLLGQFGQCVGDSLADQVAAADASAGPIWRQVLATSVSYGVFLAALTVAVFFRRWLFNTPDAAGLSRSTR